MSSTVNVQNLLTNVFRPVYTYAIPVGGTVAVYTPKLEMSNIDSYSGNSVTVLRANVSDANSNVYVGTNSGNEPTLLRNCFRNTALGYGAANLISNVSNSVYIGLNAGTGAIGACNAIAIGNSANSAAASSIAVGNTATALGNGTIAIGSIAQCSSTSSSSIAIGEFARVQGASFGQIAIGSNASTGTGSESIAIGLSATAEGTNQIAIGTGALAGPGSELIAIGYRAAAFGSNNIYIGRNTGGGGSNNVFLGPGVAAAAVSNQLRIGSNANIIIAGNFPNRWAGIGGTLAPAYPTNKLDVLGNTYILGNLGINNDPQNYALNVNGQANIENGGGAYVRVQSGGVTATGTIQGSNVTATSTVQGSNVTATNLMTASNGFTSIRGTVTTPGSGIPTTIGTTKIGMIMVSCARVLSSYSDYAAELFISPSAGIVNSLTGGLAVGTAFITYAGTSIQIVDYASGGNYNYSITYFPLI